MLRLFKRIHRLLYFLSVLILFSLCFPILYFLARNPQKNYQTIASFRRWISVNSARLVGFRFQIHFEEPIDWSRNYIICPNHTSILDITVLTFLCPQAFSFIGKEELLNNPVTRIFFRTIDIPVKRESKISSFKAYKRASALLGEGKSVVIFPEGKIDDIYPPILHSFKPGAFRMAVEQNVPILPVVIHNAWNLMWDDGGTYGSKPGCIQISVLKPIQTDALNSPELNSIEQDLFEKMNKLWQKNERVTITKNF